MAAAHRQKLENLARIRASPTKRMLCRKKAAVFLAASFPKSAANRSDASWLPFMNARSYLRADFGEN
jgi:hypothetical protein